MRILKLVQYAGIAIITLCLLVLGGVYVQQKFFPFDKSVKTASVEKEQSSSNGQQEPNTKESNKHLKLSDYERILRHETYIYALTREKIAEAQEVSKTRDFINFFTIPAQSSTIDDGDIRRVIIDTPFYTAAVYFNLNGGSPKEDVSVYDFEEALTFTIVFEKGVNSLYTVRMYQDGNEIGKVGDLSKRKIEYEATSFQTILLDIDKTDFTKPATIVITDKRDSTKKAEYKVVFADYVR
ncbi:hypothetical protein [Aneurinibacillus uraniidurans]|uniref:hypothetical protein n=1 Tax=Aneurinibacillus uraniidurans TaxID=2966586 RepID=UPI00234A5033|nr:hypothetical protein [Aneurinibacillus sp. B1]WCN39634.1 hypothetical protein PO771_09615 [Aneurinibacillus sp. B1]